MLQIQGEVVNPLRLRAAVERRDSKVVSTGPAVLEITGSDAKPMLSRSLTDLQPLALPVLSILHGRRQLLSVHQPGVVNDLARRCVVTPGRVVPVFASFEATR